MWDACLTSSLWNQPRMVKVAILPSRSLWIIPFQRGIQNLSPEASSKQQESKAHQLKLHGKDCECKKTKDRKAALKEVELTVSPSATMNKQSPEDQELPFLSWWWRVQPAEEFVWVCVSHDTHDGSCGGRSVIEKGQENRITELWEYSGTSCLLHNCKAFASTDFAWWNILIGS